MNPLPTDEEKRLYEGRKICEEEELGAFYQGSCPLEEHVFQLRDSPTWIHRAKQRWDQAADKAATAGGRESFVAAFYAIRYKTRSGVPDYCLGSETQVRRYKYPRNATRQLKQVRKKHPHYCDDTAAVVRVHEIIKEIPGYE